MDAKKLPAKDPPWKAFAAALFGIYLVAFSAYNLYEWYAIGQIYLHNFSKPQWRSFAEEPIYFSCIATVYVSVFLLFGVGSFISLINWFWQGHRSFRRRK